MGPEKVIKLSESSLTIYINDVTRGSRDKLTLGGLSFSLLGRSDDKSPPGMCSTHCTSLAAGEFIVDISIKRDTGFGMGHRGREKRQGVCPLIIIIIIIIIFNTYIALFL